MATRMAPWLELSLARSKSTVDRQDRVSKNLLDCNRKILSLARSTRLDAIWWASFDSSVKREVHHEYLCPLKWRLSRITTELVASRFMVFKLMNLLGSCLSLSKAVGSLVFAMLFQQSFAMDSAMQMDIQSRTSSGAILHECFLSF